MIKVLPFIKQNAHILLTVAAVTTTTASVLVTIENAPKAKEVLQAYHEEYGDKENWPKMDVIRDVGKLYIPTVLLTSAAILSIVSLNVVHCRRYAALSALYGISKESFKKYKDKVREIFGAKKESEVRDEIAGDILKVNPVKEDNVISTSNGKMLCYDGMSGRYFRSDIEYIRRIRSDLNVSILMDGSCTLNEFYYALELDSIDLGDLMGWHTDDLFEINFTSKLSSTGEPCLVLDYDVNPIGNWDKRGDWRYKS